MSRKYGVIVKRSFAHSSATTSSLSKKASSESSTISKRLACHHSGEPTIRPVFTFISVPSDDNVCSQSHNLCLTGGGCLEQTCGELPQSVNSNRDAKCTIGLHACQVY